MGEPVYKPEEEKQSKLKGLVPVRKEPKVLTKKLVTTLLVDDEKALDSKQKRIGKTSRKRLDRFFEKVGGVYDDVEFEKFKKGKLFRLYIAPTKELKKVTKNIRELAKLGFEVVQNPDGSFLILNHNFIPEVTRENKKIRDSLKRAKKLAEGGKLEEAMRIHGTVLAILECDRTLSDVAAFSKMARKYKGVDTGFSDLENFDDLFGVSYKQYKKIGMGGLARVNFQNAAAACSTLRDDLYRSLESGKIDEKLARKVISLRLEAAHYFERATVFLGAARSIRELRNLKKTRAKKGIAGIRQLYDIRDEYGPNGESESVQNPSARDEIYQAAKKAIRYFQGQEQLHHKVLELKLKERYYLAKGDFKELKNTQKELLRTLRKLGEYKEKVQQYYGQALDYESRAIEFELGYKSMDAMLIELEKSAKSGDLLPFEMLLIADVLDQFDRKVLKTKKKTLIDSKGKKHKVPAIRKVRYKDPQENLTEKLALLRIHLRNNPKLAKLMNYDVTKLDYDESRNKFKTNNKYVRFQNAANEYIGKMFVYSWGYEEEGASIELFSQRKKRSILGIESMIAILLPDDITMDDIRAEDTKKKKGLFSTSVVEKITRRLDKIGGGPTGLTLSTKGFKKETAAERRKKQGATEQERRETRRTIESLKLLRSLIRLRRRVVKDEISLDKAHKTFKKEMGNFAKSLFSHTYERRVYELVDELNALLESKLLNEDEKKLMRSVLKEIGFFERGVEKTLDKIKDNIKPTALRRLSSSNVDRVLVLSRENNKAANHLIAVLNAAKAFAWSHHYRRAKTLQEKREALLMARASLNSLHKLAYRKGLTTKDDYAPFVFLVSKLNELNIEKLNERGLDVAFKALKSAYTWETPWWAIGAGDTYGIASFLIEELEEHGFEEKIKEFGTFKRTGYRVLRFLDKESGKILAISAIVGFVAGLASGPGAAASSTATRTGARAVLSRITAGATSLARIRYAIHSSLDLFGVSARILGAASFLPMGIGAYDYITLSQLEDMEMSKSEVKKKKHDALELVHGSVGHAIWGMIGPGRALGLGTGYRVVSGGYNTIFMAGIGTNLYATFKGAEGRDFTVMEKVTVVMDSAFLSIPVLRGTSWAVRTIGGWRRARAPVDHLARMPYGDMVLTGLWMYDEEIMEYLGGKIAQSMDKGKEFELMKIYSQTVEYDPAAIPNLSELTETVAGYQSAEVMQDYQGASPRTAKRFDETYVLSALQHLDLLDDETFKKYLQTVVIIGREDVNPQLKKSLEKLGFKIKGNDALAFLMEFVLDCENNSKKRKKLEELLIRNPELKKEDINDEINGLVEIAKSWRENDQKINSI